MKYLILLVSISLIIVTNSLLATPPDLILSVDSTGDLDEFFGIEAENYSNIFGSNVYYTSMSYMQSGSTAVYYALININNEVYSLAIFENNNWSVIQVDDQNFETWYQDTFNSSTLEP